MPDPTTTNKSLDLPANGEYPNAWDVPVNQNFTDIDTALGGLTSISVTGVAAATVTLTRTQYLPPQITFSGTIGGDLNYQLPSGVGGEWLILNSTTGAHTLTISSGGAGTSVVILQGGATSIGCDGTNVRYRTQSLRAIDGAVATPAVSFASSTGSGLYWTGAAIGHAFGGSLIWTETSAGVTFQSGKIVTADAGSVSAPAINFGSSGTGFYAPAANQSACTINGTQAYLTTSAGTKFNLAVGSTTGTDPIAAGVTGWQLSPAAVLVVNGANTNSVQFGRAGSDGVIANFFRDTTIVGTISVTATATSYNTSSDYRLKDDPQPPTQAGATIDAIKVYDFRWRATGERDVGCFAHELQAIWPRAVTGQKDAQDDQGSIIPQEVDYSKLIPLMLAEIQSIRQRLARGGL